MIFFLLVFKFTVWGYCNIVIVILPIEMVYCVLNCKINSPKDTNFLTFLT
jgi:hypothetical protein